MTNITLSITNSKGRQVNLLNDDCSINNIKNQKTKKRYYCPVSGCQKSFTTSGHLARHHRIHTGEKNFHCLHPGCPSKFSRQDNMMQHYKTHISSRSRLYYYHHYPRQSLPYQHYQNYYQYSEHHEPQLYYSKNLKSCSPNNKREWSVFSTSSTGSSTGSSNSSVDGSHSLATAPSPTFSPISNDYQNYHPYQSNITLPPLHKSPNNSLNWIHHSPDMIHQDIKSKNFYFEGYA